MRRWLSYFIPIMAATFGALGLIMTLGWLSRTSPVLLVIALALVFVVALSVVVYYTEPQVDPEVPTSTCDNCAKWLICRSFDKHAVTTYCDKYGKTRKLNYRVVLKDGTVGWAEKEAENVEKAPTEH